MCCICQGSDWNVSDTIFELREFNNGSLGGGAIQPIVTLTCLNCGQTIMQNAIKVGVVYPRIKEGNNNK